MRLAAIILLGASISCFAPVSSPAQTTPKNVRFDKERASVWEKILAEKGSDYLSRGTGNCQLGIDFQDLDVNNVRARLYNTGGLFWRGAGPLYNVPKETSGNSIFAHGIWIGGMVDGELHMAASDYGPWEFWPGPLDDDGNPPEDCSQYDRLYKVSREDVLEYDDTGVATPDLADWPYKLGAPVIDGDRDPNNYNLAGGDRPQVIGDQTIWWVMNDMGNSHNWSLARPLGLEVQATAFAFNDTWEYFNDHTFYKYTLINKGNHRIEDTWFGIWTDADLGDGSDDYVGSDTARSLGFTWNADDFDGGSDGYGDLPPAVGAVLIQGPLANNDGIDNDDDGETDEDDERLGMTTSISYIGDHTIDGNPNDGTDAYNYLRGFWRNGQHLTYGGRGLTSSNDPTQFQYPGDPPAFWSEENIDGNEKRNSAGDRRFLVASGPFSLDPDEVQEIMYAIVWAQGEDRFSSVQKLKSAAALARVIGWIDPVYLERPDAPTVTASVFDASVVLSWSNSAGENNYLDQYEGFNEFLADVDVEDKTYSFEGYEVIQYESEKDPEGQVIATFDIANGVTTVVDITDATANIPIAQVAVEGTDSGIRHSMKIDGLDNYRDYYFGVRAYAYNEHSAPLIWPGKTARVTVRPSRPDARNGGTRIAEGAFDATFTEENGRVTKTGRGNGRVWANVVDPSVLTGDTYRVRFYEEDASSEREQPRIVTNYDVLRSDGSKAFDGRTAVESFGAAAPQRENVLTIDGLSFSVLGPEPGVLEIDPEGGRPAFVQVESPSPSWCIGNGSVEGCSQVGGDLVYGSFNDTHDWIMYRHGGDGPETSIGAFAPHDFEIRVTENGSYGYHAFGDGNNEIHWVPFEIWDIGITPPFAINDPTDDEQLVPVMLSDNGGTCAINFGEIEEDPFGFGWPVTDRIYAYYALKGRSANFHSLAKAFVEAHPDGCPAAPYTESAAELIDFDRGRPLQRLTFMMDPTSPDYRPEFIPVGNVIRFFTTKPNLPGDVFTVNTSGYAVETNVQEVARDALDLISIVPNPYKGASDYELTGLDDVARFTNLPERATIRVFNLSGTLVRQIEKIGPEPSMNWDLLTDTDLPLASGMYLVHVEVPDVGSKVIKFGLVKKRIQLQLY